MQYRRRLRSRLIISFALFGIALTVLFAVATLSLRTRVEDQLVNDTLQREVARFLAFKRDNPDPNAPWSFSSVRGYIYGINKIENVPFEWKSLSNGNYNITDIGDDGKPHRFKLAVDKADDLWAFLRYDASKEELGERQLIVGLVGVVILFSLFAILLGVWSSARVMRPVTDLARRVKQFGKTRRAEPLAPHFANDEVGELAAALDNYSDKLTALVERDREFNADVSHELRTPLAVIASTTELMLASSTLTDKLRDRLKRIERASKQATELTNALLLLSRSERSGPTDGETTDVAKIAEQIIDMNRPNIGNKPVTVRLELDEVVEVDAPSAVIAVALNNLIGNGIKYTQAGDVVVRVGAGRVVVEDSGPGIAIEDAEKLFVRGVRGEGAAGKGAGLGLAIVRRLCELYGWHVSLAPRPQGGAAATLDFRLKH
ncbi:HAMP domain-containing histidine kinase [Pseudolysobacter antarcticus]|uniref:histidine kinase n=1 Tax=Pseudolysobacter antarcticus TaxID=2511995 RepID=A0A411HN75_9GAMM|nr:HAMP domain-containing sensor histidine kinase [Pseudolysobacter antarcticus]QBB71928.1 HAMP domain-containing histidine kinase [Pseudolysobacter antarcticus]